VRIDFGRTAADYGRYRAGFPEALFDRLSRWGIGRPLQRVLDLGTGTGIHSAYLRDVALAGFEQIETFSFDVPVTYSHEEPLLTPHGVWAAVSRAP
jgi:hypothetical protein